MQRSAMASKVKRLLLQLAAGVLYHTGIFRLRRFLRRAVWRKDDVCVLGLHRVLSPEEESRANSLPAIVLRKTTFAEILKFLKRHYRVISLAEFLGDREGEGKGGRSRPRCLLTFDDGWRDNLTTAYPLLKNSGVTAVIFLVTGLIGGRETFWVERLKAACESPSRGKQILTRFQESTGLRRRVDLDNLVESLKQMPASKRSRMLDELLQANQEVAETSEGDRMLDWEEVAAMQRDGIEFEAHTVTHPLLIHEDDERIRHELVASRQAVEGRLGKKVRAFAYPNGTWDERVRNLVRESGYECAFTTDRGWYSVGQDRFIIPRILLHEAHVTGIDGRFSPALLSLRLSGWR